MPLTTAGGIQSQAGQIVTVTGDSGETIKVRIPAVIMSDASGNALGTGGNPLVTSGGGGGSASTSNARLVSSAATTNATVVKSSSGTVARVEGYNANAAARYLKLYNKATVPTVGTDVPFYTKYLPPQSAFVIDLNVGLTFTAGIGYAITVNAVDSDNTAIGAGDIMAMNVVYS